MSSGMRLFFVVCSACALSKAQWRLSGNIVGPSINLGSMEILAQWMKRKVMSIFNIKN